MLTVEEINQVPQGLKLMAWSEREWNGAPGGKLYLLEKSANVWAIRNQQGESILVAGLFRPAAIGFHPELWLLVCQAFKHNLRHNLIESRKLLREQLLPRFPHVIVQVDADFPTGTRFAEFMGFRSTGRMERAADREYHIYEIN